MVVRRKAGSTMNQEQEDRLNRLADYLDTVDQCHYDQNVWGHNVQLDDDAPAIVGLENMKRAKLEVKCGTSACALGHSTTLWPNTFGLVVEYYPSIDSYSSRGRLVAFDSNKEAHEVSPFFDEDYEGDRIVCDFFGITEGEACYLFGPEDGRACSPETKAQQIREVIASHKQS